MSSLPKDRLRDIWFRLDRFSNNPSHIRDRDYIYVDTETLIKIKKAQLEIEVAIKSLEDVSTTNQMITPTNYHFHHNNYVCSATSDNEKRSI